MKANDVIRIGLRRTRAPSSAASTRAPRFEPVFRELHDEDGILRGEANQHDQSDLCEDVEVEAAQ
jgi:hypothetical protein